MLLNRILLPWNVIVGVYFLFSDQVENAQTSLSLKFSSIFHCKLYWKTTLSSACERRSTSTLFLAVVKIETSPENTAVTASSESSFARSVI